MIFHGKLKLTKKNPEISQVVFGFEKNKLLLRHQSCSKREYHNLVRARVLYLSFTEPSITI